MILAELLDTGLQLPGDMWPMLPLECFTPMGDVNRPLQTDSGGVKHLLALNMKFKLWSRRSWHLVIGNREGSHMSE